MHALGGVYVLAPLADGRPDQYGKVLGLCVQATMRKEGLTRSITWSHVMKPRKTQEGSNMHRSKATGTAKKVAKDAQQPKPQTVPGTISIPIDFDPTRTTTSSFSKMGIGWLLQQLYFLGLSFKPDEGKTQLEMVLEAVGKEGREIVEKSELLKHLRPEDQVHAEQGIEILKQNQDTKEWWAFLAMMWSHAAKDALESNDTRLGMWAVTLMNAARSMMIYKQCIEKSMWRGYATAELIQSILDAWAKNREETREEFWQTTLRDNSLILSQLFAFPVVILKGKAYVGGKGIDNAGGKLVDFLITNQLSQNAALIEIKTPKTCLLDAVEYRDGVFPVSRELAGAVSQVLSYKDMLAVEYLSVRHNSTEPFNAFNPQCMVIAGHYAEELDTKQKTRSFELFRSSLKDVQLITYDEVFTKLEALKVVVGA